MRQIFTITLLHFIFLSQALAGVDLRTGNYFVTYTDIDFPNSKAEITRSYSSTSSNSGMFGFGWGSVIETRLYPLPDGTLLLKWWGGGQGDYYEPAVVNKQGLFKMINAIIENLVATGKLANNPVAIADKKSYYLANNRERAQRYVDLQTGKKIPPYLPPANKKMSWVQDMNQAIDWDGKQFKVKSWQDAYTFNKLGLLLEIKDQQFNMQFSYAANRLQKILVDNKYWCHFETDSVGRITRITMQDSLISKTAVFQYDSLNNLLYSKDAGDNEYRFSYDLYHNLVRISYQDATFVEMVYDPASNRLIKFRDKNGSFQTYQYPYFYTEDGKVNYQHYATTVKKYDSLGTLFFTQYKEYENRVKDNGSTYLHRLVEKTDTSFHEALYDPEVENASFRKNNNGQAWAQYDSKHRPTYLLINDTLYQVAYNKMDLPQYFSKIDTVQKDTLLYTYSYNDEKELSGVIKNNTHYTIIGSKEKIWMTVKNDKDELKIGFKNGKAYSIQHARWGITVIDDAEWRKLDSTLNPTAYTKRIATQDNPVASGSNREVASKKMTEMEARKEAMARMKRSQTESQSVDRRAKLLMLWAEFSDVVEPKEIRHEWIWERL